MSTCQSENYFIALVMLVPMQLILNQPVFMNFGRALHTFYVRTLFQSGTKEFNIQCRSDIDFNILYDGL